VGGGLITKSVSLALSQTSAIQPTLQDHVYVASTSFGVPVTPQLLLVLSAMW